MPRKTYVKSNRKNFKRLTRSKDKKVPNVKPYPIPDLEGQAAEVFEKQIKVPLTNTQKRMIKEGTIVFAETKKHK